MKKIINGMILSILATMAISCISEIREGRIFQDSYWLYSDDTLSVTFELTRIDKKFREAYSRDYGLSIDNRFTHECKIRVKIYSKTENGYNMADHFDEGFIYFEGGKAVEWYDGLYPLSVSEDGLAGYAQYKEKMCCDGQSLLINNMFDMSRLHKVTKSEYISAVLSITKKE